MVIHHQLKFNFDIFPKILSKVLTLPPKQICSITATILFTLASAATKGSIIPLIVVINSINHHYLFPDNQLLYLVDMGFNTTYTLLYSYSSVLVRRFGLLTITGWIVGQLMGGCNNKIGVWFHVLFCQIPGALGTVAALSSTECDPPYQVIQFGVVCGWMWAVFCLLLPSTLHDRTRVAWALVCFGIGITGTYQGLKGYFYNEHKSIDILIALQIVHELGGLVAEFAQRKVTNFQYCTHHILFLIMLLMHRPEWHDAEERVYRMPNGESVYTEQDVVYLLGCTEISSMFLQMVTAASDTGWVRDGLVARSLHWTKPAFALSYIGVRVIWWPIHAWPMIYNALGQLVQHNQLLTIRLLSGSVAVCMAGLSTMQLQWGYIIMRKAIRTVIYYKEI